MARRAHCRFLSLVLASSFALMGLPGLAPGQAREVEQVQLYGRVQWATASKMVITTDCGFLERGCTPTSVAIGASIGESAPETGSESTALWLIATGSTGSSRNQS